MQVTRGYVRPGRPVKRSIIPNSGRTSHQRKHEILRRHVEGDSEQEQRKNKKTRQSRQSRQNDAVVGDGSGEFPTLSSAVNSGATSILITKGTFQENQNIIINDNIRIRGESELDSQIVIPSGINFEIASSGVVCQNFLLAFSRSSFDISNARNVLIESVTFLGLSGIDYGIRVDNSPRVRVKECVFQRCQRAVLLNSSLQADIDSCLFNNNADCVVMHGGSSSNYVRNTKIRNCVFENCSRGIVMEGAQEKFFFTGNSTDDCRGHAVDARQGLTRFGAINSNDFSDSSGITIEDAAVEPIIVTGGLASNVRTVNSIGITGNIVSQISYSNSINDNFPGKETNVITG